jgi:DNA-binding LytR/AlgR family response regulator
MTISCLIVEDQLPAQRILSSYIDNLPHLELAGICGNAFEAMAIFHDRPIDLMFLDLNMPRLCGFDFLRTLAQPPKVIVTTAYPEHAVEGFDLNVVDYLVKPISFDRFIRAVDKVRQPGTPEPAPPPANVTGPPAQAGSAEEIFVRIENEFRRLSLADIFFVRAEKDYVSIVTTMQNLFVSGPLSSWAERLRSDRFVRVHKSYIVNLAHVSSIRGSTIVTPAGGVPIGRSYRDQLLQRVG